jgi:hypothetical protein
MQGGVVREMWSGGREKVREREKERERKKRGHDKISQG